MNGQPMKTIDFMRWAPHMSVFSVVMTVAAILFIVIKGLNLGLDFTGGTVLEVEYTQVADLDRMRETLAGSGYDDAIVQNFGTAHDVLVRIPPREGQDMQAVGESVYAVLRQVDADVKLLRSEFVGPAVGDELRDESGVALVIALIAMMLYVAVRFVWRLSVGGVLALFHDAIVTVGFFAATGMTFDLTVLAAVLAVIGYSINDTIVVADRIRENFRTVRKGSPAEIINGAVTQTLSRTIMTSSTTLLAVLALFYFGGEAIHNFALALLVGIGFGTYSSVFIAGAAMLYLGVSRDDFIVKMEEVDERP